MEDSKSYVVNLENLFQEEIYLKRKLAIFFESLSFVDIASPSGAAPKERVHEIMFVSKILY